jgi:hypothetical protein
MKDRRLVFSVFARPEILQEGTIKAGSDQEEILADGVTRISIYSTKNGAVEDRPK